MDDSAENKGLALLIVDMINPLDFSGGAAMLPFATTAAERIARLKHRLQGSGVPVIYINDNFAHWQMDFRELVAICSHDSRGAPLARLLAPGRDDHFVLKPKHSAFYETPLPTLLAKLKIGDLVITGLATDNCVLATAMDAHTRIPGARAARLRGRAHPHPQRPCAGADEGCDGPGCAQLPLRAGEGARMTAHAAARRQSPLRSSHGNRFFSIRLETAIPG